LRRRAVDQKLGRYGLEKFRWHVRRGPLDLARLRRPGAGRPFCAKGVFRKEGEYWTVAYGQKAFRLKDTKALGHLALLDVGQYADPLARGLERIGAPL
jgi:hypothetical protein